MTHRRTYPKKQSLVLGGVLLILLIAAYPAAARPEGWVVTSKNNLILVSPGSQGVGGGSYTAISSNGRYVAFESFASDLAPGHIDESWDVFVSDLQNSQVQRVSMRSDGSPVYNPGDYTCAPSMGGSGRYVAFMSRASDLVPGDDNGMPDIFLRDRQTGTTRLVSVAVDGSPANGPSFTPVVSTDGRFVAFQSLGNDLVANDTNDAMDVFVRDMVAGITRRISVTDSGAEGYSPYEYAVSPLAMSADGRIVAFSYEGLPYPGLTSSEAYIYIRDQQANTTRMVATGSHPALSSDGRYLVFLTSAELVPNDKNYSLDVYLFDRRASAFEQISFGGGPGDASQEIVSAPDVSDDGRYIVFESTGGFAGGTQGLFQIYLRDRESGTTTQLDRPMDGSPAGGESHSPVISDDGRSIAFTSTAPNLVPNDRNNASDVFVYLNNRPSAVTQDYMIFLPTLYKP